MTNPTQTGAGTCRGYRVAAVLAATAIMFSAAAVPAGAIPTNDPKFPTCAPWPYCDWTHTAQR